MKHLTHTILILSFCLWLIPLGRFISHDREAQACGGQRAICLCSKNLTQAKSNHGGKIEWSTNSAHHDQRAPSGSSGHDLELATAPLLIIERIVANTAPQALTYPLLVNRPIDVIPKA